MRNLVLRPALLADIDTLQKWDQEPHVISATTDKTDAKQAFGDHDWRHELQVQNEFYRYYIAELDGRPIGGMNICDAHNEQTHYWGSIPAGTYAIDIWIGAKSDLGHGYGEEMMKQALEICFSDPAVHTIVIDPLNSNLRAHKFYQRIGFRPVGRQTFGEDDCLVHRMTRTEWERLKPNGSDVF